MMAAVAATMPEWAYMRSWGTTLAWHRQGELRAAWLPGWDGQASNRQRARLLLLAIEAGIGGGSTSNAVSVIFWV
jgi:hypothetical protein